MRHIYRHKKNGKLYLLYRCKPMMHLGYHVEAVPFNHNDYITKRCNNNKKYPHVNVDDFNIVAYF